MKGKIALALLALVLVWPAFGQTIATKYYVVSASDGQGDESAFSNEASCAVTAAKPHCLLTWNASTSIVAGYNVWRSATSGSGYIKVNTALVTGLTYTDLVTPPNPPAGLAGVASN